VKRVVINLTEDDFVAKSPPRPTKRFAVSTGPSYPLGDKFQEELGKINAPCPEAGVRFRFENDDGSVWGGLGPEFWVVCRAKEMFQVSWTDRGGKVVPLQNRKAFIANRGWLGQQIHVAESLGHTDAKGGFHFHYSEELRKKFGKPSRIVAEVEVYLEILKSV
jgi:hypothetical protein